MSTRKTIIDETGLNNSGETPLVKIAVMNNDIRHINETLGRLEGKFDIAVQSFATNQQLIDAIAAFEAKFKEQSKIIENTQNDLRSLRDKDAAQQGAIDANKQSFTRAVSIISVVAVALGALWWVPSLLQGLHK